MKVLHIIPSLKSGGAELYCIELSNYLAQQKIEINILTTEKKLTKIINSKIKFIYYNVSSKNPIKIFYAIKFLKKLIQENNFNIIHTHSRIPAIITYFAIKNLKHLNIKFINTLHGLYKNNNNLQFEYNKFAFSADLCFSVSSFATKYYYNFFNIQNFETINTIESGINLNYYNGESTSERLFYLVSKLNLSPNLKLLIMPARFTDSKGHIFLLQALSKIKYENYKCIMVGDIKKKPNYVNYIFNVIKNLNLDKHVTILENFNEMKDLYILSYAVFALSTEEESFGRTPIEAFAIGRPVITTNLGPYRENIIHAKNGFLVDPHNTHKLAETIDLMFNLENKKWEEMCTFAKSYAEKYFSNEIGFKKIIEIYQNH